MEVLSGFVLGILGSFHCAGMCGPLALALPHAGSSKPEMITGAALYNIGRAVTYAFMGAILGALGASVKLAGYQQVLSVITGVILLLSVLLPSRIKNKLFFASPLHAGFSWLKTFFQKFMRIRSYPSLFVIGLINGLLPCGLVYIALAGAAVTSDVLYGAVYMALFGLGTLPMMLFISLAGNMMKVNWRQKLVRLVPVGIGVVSILLILRGLSLGIPYISPKLNTAASDQHNECCH